MMTNQQDRQVFMYLKIENAAVGEKHLTCAFCIRQRQV